MWHSYNDINHITFSAFSLPTLKCGRKKQLLPPSTFSDYFLFAYFKYPFFSRPFLHFYLLQHPLPPSKKENDILPPRGLLFLEHWPTHGHSLPFFKRGVGRFNVKSTKTRGHAHFWVCTFCVKAFTPPCSDDLDHKDLRALSAEYYHMMCRTLTSP